MTNQLSHANLFPDLSNVTLRRVFNTDQGWIMEAHGQDSAVCPGCQSISRSRHSPLEVLQLCRPAVIGSLDAPSGSPATQIAGPRNFMTAAVKKFCSKIWREMPSSAFRSKCRAQ